MIVSNKLEYNTAVAERRRLFQQALPLYVKCDIIYARILFVLCLLVLVSVTESC